jgi:Fibronectin type III domain
MFIRSAQIKRSIRHALLRSLMSFRPSGILAGILLLVLMQNPIQADQSVILGWQPSSDPNVVGYRIYYGTTSHNYTSKVSIGNLTSVTIEGLADGTTYYFAATTVSDQNQESGFSNEAIYQVPAAVTTNNVQNNVQICSATAGQFMLTVTGQAGGRFAIEATQDFAVWTVIGIANVGAGGSVNFTDTNLMNFPQRFYRARPLQPPIIPVPKPGSNQTE